MTNYGRGRRFGVEILGAAEAPGTAKPAASTAMRTFFSMNPDPR